MATPVLGLQGGIASGAEETFDGQPMQPGTHLRWSFSPELGFPPGGFWLCRRVVSHGERQFPPPASVRMPGTTPGGPTTTNGVISSLPGTNQWQAETPEPCQSVTLAGCAAEGCDEILIETFCRKDDGTMELTGRQAVRVHTGAFRIRVAAQEISCVRVTGAGSVDECGCGTVEPPENCGCGGTTGGGPPPPCTGQPGWGPPGDDGWQCWGVPFTLPVTNAHWPARYFGAPDPSTMPDSEVAKKDVQEAIRRLGSLRLEAGLNAAQQRHELWEMRGELKRLVQGFPGTLLPDVSMQPSPAGANAPGINLNLMQQLLLLALDPYFARVLGLYFVDDQTDPGVSYDYCITGYWGSTPCQAEVLFPGSAPGAPLARGLAQFDGMAIEVANANTSLWRWTRDDVNGNYLPRTDPTAPGAIAPVMNAAIGALSPAQQPDAILALYSFSRMFGFITPAPSATIVLPQPVQSVDVQVAGRGTVVALSGGSAVATAGFNSATLASVTATAPSAATPIDTIQVSGIAQLAFDGIVAAVGAITLHLLSGAIGTRYAMIHAPRAIVRLPAPAQPISTFIHRQADIDPVSLQLIPHSVYSVEWPAPPTTAAMTTGNPVSDPIDLPPPDRPVGFVAERQDSGKPSLIMRLPRWTAAASSPTPSKSKIMTERLYRVVDSGRPDPLGGWSYRVGGFDLFGAMGHWSSWTAPLGVEKVAAAPTNLRIVQFDNTPAGGGAAAVDGSAWVGGTLTFQANWSGASFIMFPDIETARATVSGLKADGRSAGDIATLDFALPTQEAQALTVKNVNVTPPAPGKSAIYTVTVETNPPLPALQPRDPAALLQLTLADGTIERYLTRPSAATSAGPVVAVIQAGASARIVATANDFVGQPAYLVAGFSFNTSMQVPLSVPIDQNTARGQLSVRGSTKNPFDPNEQVIDPNGLHLPHNEPESVKLIFAGAQRLVPPTPSTPVHEVHHLFYDPADYTGLAGRTLPFDTSGGAGILGYILQRALVRSICLSDVKRRIALNNAADPSPVVPDGGKPQRADLAAWITSLNQWLTAYNTVAGTNLTPANVLSDTVAQPAFIEHFYGGLLDDELRALGDIPENSPGFARVNPQPHLPSTPFRDTVNGTGYGRTVYKMLSVNSSGSTSGFTNSIGPYYTRIVTPPRPPVLYKLQPTSGAIVVAWTLDANPDVAGYLVYRGTSADALGDLRHFGADPSHPSDPATLAQIAYDPKAVPCLSFGAGSIDPRIIGFVPDPRFCARDYEDSDMGEITLPAGPEPDAINGVYRLSEFNTSLAPLNQTAFNYWTPPATGGIAQIINDGLRSVRLTGLRIGLGRGIPVVVVATYKGKVKVFGQVTMRRAAFTDGVLSNGNPIDPNTLPGATPPPVNVANYYAVVAVDIFGNLSSPSSVFAAQALAKAA